MEIELLLDAPGANTVTLVMEENATASTDANLVSLARSCNEFFEANLLRYTIKDLAIWVSKKPNPFYFPKSDARKRRISDGMILVIKGLLKFYSVGKEVNLVYESQFTHDLWVRTDRDQLKKMFSNAVTEDQWRLCRTALIKVGILRINLIRNERWGSLMELQIDFDQLKAIIAELPNLKRLIPGNDNWPLPSRPGSNDAPNIVSNALSSSIAREESIPVESSTPLDDGDSTKASGERKTSHVVGDSLLQKPQIDFSNVEFRGTLDTEGEFILGLIRQTFDEPITCGLIRKLNYLRRRHPRIALTIERIAKYFEYRAEHGCWPVLPDWMVKLPLEKLLAPGIWVSVLNSINRHAHDSVVEDVEFLKTAGEYELTAVQTAYQVFDRPEEFWQTMIVDAKNEGKPWLCYALYGWRKGWSNLLMETIRAKAKAMLSNMPVFFMRTEQIIGWSRLLGLTEKEAAEIRQKGDNKLRATEARIYLAQQAGAI